MIFHAAVTTIRLSLSPSVTWMSYYVVTLSAVDLLFISFLPSTVLSVTHNRHDIHSYSQPSTYAILVLLVGFMMVDE